MRRKTIEIKNFIKPLHTLALRDDFRPAMQHIYFENGNAIVTNGHAILVQSLKYIEMLSDEEIENLNGYGIHYKSYQHLLKFKWITINEPGVITASNMDGSNKVLFVLHKMNADNKGNDLRFPDYNKAISSFFEKHKQEVDSIGIKPNYLTDVYKCLYNTEIDGIKLDFINKNSAICIKPNSYSDYHQEAYIMPVMLND